MHCVQIIQSLIQALSISPKLDPSTQYSCQTWGLAKTATDVTAHLQRSNTTQDWIGDGVRSSFSDSGYMKWKEIQWPYSNSSKIVQMFENKIMLAILFLQELMVA